MRPIINIGRFRIDPPGRDRSLVENLKFFLFVAVLLGIFLLLSQLQARWLMSRNAASQVPGWITTAPPAAAE